MIASTAANIGIAAALLAGLAIAAEIGFRFGRRLARRKQQDKEGDNGGGDQLGAVQGAVLGLLGLLLGFSFAAAASRYVEKQDLIAEEANAIGTAYLRADLLPEPHAGHLRSALSEYVEHRLAVSASLAVGPMPADAQPRVAEFHKRIWSAARDGSLARPDVVEPVIETVNEVIDLHALRMYMGKKHLPIPILALLVLCSLLAMGVIGFGHGLAQSRSLPMALSLAMLIAATLWMTIDFDHPRVGLIRLTDAPLEELPFRR